MSIKNIVNYEIPESKSSEPKGGVAKLAWKILAYFLIFMILFSVLSRATSSMTTAKVTVTNVKSGTLEHSFKFNGNLENNQKVAISTNSGLLISKIDVKKGTEVKIGDVVMVLDAEALETEYLKAKKTLEDAQYTISDAKSADAVQDYKDDKILERLKEDYQNQVISDSYNSYSSAAAVQEAQQALNNFDWSKYTVEDTSSTSLDFEDDYIASSDAITEQLSADVTSYQNQITAAEANLNSINLMIASYADQFKYSFSYDNLEIATVSGYEDVQRTFNYAIRDAAYMANGFADPEGKDYTDPVIGSQIDARRNQTIEEIRARSGYGAVEEELTALRTKLSEAQTSLENYRKIAQERVARQEAISEEEKEAKYQEGVAAYNQLLRAYYAACNAYQGALHSNSVSEQSKLREIEDTNDPVAAKDRELNERQYNLDMAQREFDKLQALMDTSGEIYATASGTILDVKVMEGSKTLEDVCFVIGDSSEGYTFKGTVTKEQAKYLKLGSKIVISTFNHGNNEKLNAIIEDITVSAEDKEVYEITASVNTDGESCASSGEVSVRSVSDKYDMLVPNSAIKKEKEGEYVLVLEESSGILGKTLVVRKVSVTVEDKDENNSAISSLELQSTASVIVSSDRTLKAGDSVRLNES